MKGTKMQKGITLIALIITIIILLILALVTIGVVKDSKILTYAQNASNKYTLAQEQEQIQLALSEWKIQKKYSSNTETFKSSMTSSLSTVATVSGEDDGPLGIMFSSTGNEYIVDEDGNIKADSENLKTLKTYFLGERDQTTGQRSGKSIADLLVSLEVEDITEWKFKDDNGIIPDPENIEAIASDSDENYVYILFKYNNIQYKLTVSQTEEMLCKSIEEHNIEVGERVEYDGKTWVIIYADKINGIQMISEHAIDYNGGSFYLGENDSLISNWDLLIKEVDLNNDKNLDIVEKRIYSYNHAIETLNKACENIVPKNENIIDVRCVGSNPTDKNSESSELYTENLENLPTTSQKYETGIFNGKIKDTDKNYELDYDKLVELNLMDKYNTYWLASRVNTIYRGYIRIVRDRTLQEMGGFFVIGETGVGGEGPGPCYLRPVVKLKQDVKFKSGCGIGDYPYILE